MGFWTELSEESRAVIKELPPLSSELITSFEERLGIKLPHALLDLLRTKNGGFLENTDFKFGDNEYGVREIVGIGNGDGFREIRPCSTFFNKDEDISGKETAECLRNQAGDLSRLLYFADNDYCWYALDYNRLNSSKEPTIILILPDADATEVRRVTDSFSDFLKGHYFGDVEPLVQMDEAERYTLVAQGGYAGTLHSTGAAIHVKWKICSDGGRLIIFQQENWGWGEKRQRSELRKESLNWSPIPLEDYGVDVEPDLAKLIRPTIEAECLEITTYDVGTTPKCYELGFRIPIGEQNRIKKTTSEAYEGRWKNSSSRLISISVYSDDKAALKRTLAMLAEKPKGWRRFFS